MAEPVLYVIYRILNLQNGKAYIGQTRTRMSARMASHRWESTKARPYPICRAIAKYGWENFRVDVLESGLCPTDVDERERYWIVEHDTLAPNGYNLSKGGNTNKELSPTTRLKMSLARMGRKFGPLTAEHKRKIGLANKGKEITAYARARSSAYMKKHGFFSSRTSEQQAAFSAKSPRSKGIPRSAEWKAKMSKRNSGSGNPFYGRKHSPEIRAKISRNLPPRVYSPAQKAHFSEMMKRVWKQRKEQACLP